MTAQIEHERERAPVVGPGRQSLEPVGPRLKCDIPTVIYPRRMRHPDLAKHLRGEVQNC